MVWQLPITSRKTMESRILLSLRKVGLVVAILVEKRQLLNPTTSIQKAQHFSIYPFSNMKDHLET